MTILNAATNLEFKVRLRNAKPNDVIIIDEDTVLDGFAVEVPGVNVRAADFRHPSVSGTIEITVPGVELHGLEVYGTQVGVNIHGDASRTQLHGMWIHDTSDSGVVDESKGHTIITSSQIKSIGMREAPPWPVHGIYMKAPYPYIYSNNIWDCRDDGISLRMRDSRAIFNYIKRCACGVAFFNEASFASHIHIVNNVINTCNSGVYVDKSDKGAPQNTYHLGGNTIGSPRTGGFGLLVHQPRQYVLISSPNRYTGQFKQEEVIDN